MRRDFDQGGSLRDRTSLRPVPIRGNKTMRYSLDLHPLDLCLCLSGERLGWGCRCSPLVITFRLVQEGGRFQTSGHRFPLLIRMDLSFSILIGKGNSEPIMCMVLSFANAIPWIC